MLRSKILSMLLVPVLILCTFIYPCLEVSALPVYSSLHLESKEAPPIYQTYDLSSYDSILQLIEDVMNGNIEKTVKNAEKSLVLEGLIKESSNVVAKGDVGS